MIGHIWREWYVVSCLSIQHLSTGMIFGFPAVLTPSITSNSSDVYATREEASWIAGFSSFTGAFAFLIIPYALQTYGRKITNMLWNSFTLIGTIIIAVAPNVTTLLVGRGFQGFVNAGMLSTKITIAEYSHPKRRPVFIILQYICILLGIIICHGLRILLTWRQVAWISTVPLFIGLFSTLTWPESPSWLVHVGRFDESVDAFEWLRGKDPTSGNEIRELIVAQRELQARQTDRNLFQTILNTFSSKKFLKPMGIILTAVFLMSASSLQGSAYIIEIMERLIKDKYTAYYFIMSFDFVKIFAILISTVIIRILNRRTIIHIFGMVVCLLLTVICLLGVFNDYGFDFYNWLVPFLLVLYNFLIHVTIMPATAVLKGELIPLEFKGIGLAVFGILDCIVNFITIKFTSNMLVSLKIYGTFAVYLVVIAGSLVTLYFTMPETKDRTLQHIETEFVTQKSTTECKNDSKDMEILN